MTARGDELRVEGAAGQAEADPSELKLFEAESAAAWKDAFVGVANGEPEALDRLYDLGAGAIFGLAMWRTGSIEDASDVVQEVFLRLVAERERLVRVSRPRAWLLSLAHHAAVDLARRRKRRAAMPLDDVPFLTAPPGDAERGLDAARASRLVGELPPAQRDVVYLRHFEELTFAEIGRITSVPTFTAASRYRLGMNRLRRLMGSAR